MSLINDYLKKTQDEAPHREQPADVPPTLKGGGTSRGGRRGLRISVIAVLGIIAGVAYYHFQSSLRKTAPPPDLVASLGERPLTYSARSKAPATSTAEQPLPVSGAIASVSATDTSQPTPTEERAAADKPTQTKDRPQATRQEPAKVAEAIPEEAEKTASPEPKQAVQIAQASPKVTIAPLQKPKEQETVEVDSNHYFQIGLIAQKDGDFQEAERFYQEVLVQDPAHMGALTNLAAVYIQQKKTADAERTLQKILRIDPKNTKALINLGIISLNRNQPDQAKERFQEALRIDPREETALINLAYLASQENDTALAEKYYKDILSITPQNVQVLLAYASLLEKNSRFAEAISCYQKSLDVPAVKENDQLCRQIRDRIDVLRYYYGAPR